MILTAEGKAAAPAVAEEVLVNDQIDGALIKRFLLPGEVDELEEVHALSEEGLVASALMAIAPQLHEVREVVTEYWRNHGYRGYEISPDLYYTDFVPAGRGIEPHIDYYDKVDKFIQAALSYSISAGATDGTADMSVVRPGSRTFKDEDGNIVVDNLLSWQDEIANGSLNWSTATMERGDVFLLPQHISPSGHSVEASLGRTAFILDYIASPEHTELI